MVPILYSHREITVAKATDHVFIAKTAIGSNTPTIVSKIAVAIVAKGIGTSVDAIAA